MTRQLKYIYIGALTPLITGSSIFLYWFYKRNWFAENADIELAAGITILGFILFGFITILLSTMLILSNAKDWKKIIAPILIIVLTIPMIDIYGVLYTSLSDKAFVRIINDTDKTVKRVWSDNFEITIFDSAPLDFDADPIDFIISYYPVYTYDWTKEDSFGYDYEITPVKIELLGNGTVSHYTLPEYSKGECRTITLTEIIKESNNAR
jgi:hypothetical protein